MTLELPMFDISKPLSESSLTSLQDACKEWGFFYITNHGISREMYQKLRRFSGGVFGMGDEEKMKMGASNYTPRFIASPFFESLRVSGPDFYASAKSSVDAFPDQAKDEEFSELMKEYGEKMTELCEKIMKAILASFGDDLHHKYYESEFGNCHGYFRINNYTIPSEQAHNDDRQDLIEGLGMHTDMSCITIVDQDDIGGLQVRSRDGTSLMDIYPKDEALVVNVGDLLHAWTNGRLRSSEHRVVLKQRSFVCNRFSLAFFWCFDDGKVVFAPDEVVGGLEDARVFQSFTCGDYLRFRESNVKGKFEKVGYTVKDFARIEGRH
ncbi:Gibberellin 20-oxidase-like protein [Cardamine amara subsp. amara]|uniref:Gibberellin 20-oxidase-like protein n=1 Tax=Cardamine amara subsp. amara TaxID=228776 RepID=A0ABD1BYJ9_CARAN